MSQFFAKFDCATKQGKTTYRAHIPEKWMILYVCLKMGTTKSVHSDPYGSSLHHLPITQTFENTVHT